MNVTVALNDGSQIYPSYDPEHKDTVIEFYNNAVANHLITGYVARLSDGSVHTSGLVL